MVASYHRASTLSRFAGILEYSVPLFLKRQCGRTLGKRYQKEAEEAEEAREKTEVK